jgi:hypothetical protein
MKERRRSGCALLKAATDECRSSLEISKMTIDVETQACARRSGKRG